MCPPTPREPTFSYFSFNSLSTRRVPAYSTCTNFLILLFYFSNYPTCARLLHVNQLSHTSLLIRYLPNVCPPTPRVPTFSYFYFISLSTGRVPAYSTWANISPLTIHVFTSFWPVCKNKCRQVLLGSSLRFNDKYNQLLIWNFEGDNAVHGVMSFIRLDVTSLLFSIKF